MKAGNQKKVLLARFYTCSKLEMGGLIRPFLFSELISLKRMNGYAACSEKKESRRRKEYIMSVSAWISLN